MQHVYMIDITRRDIKINQWIRNDEIEVNDISEYTKSVGINCDDWTT